MPAGVRCREGVCVKRDFATQCLNGSRIRFHLRFFVRAARLRVDRLPEKGMPLPAKIQNKSAETKAQTDANTVS